MALIVEDGTGLSNADAYVSVADFRAYCTGVGVDSTAWLDPAVEAALRRATSYVDSEWEYKGQVVTNLQALEFPRTGLEWNGRVFEGVPKRVKDACCDLAIAGISGALREAADRGGMVVSESVGPISVTYAEGAPAGKVYEEAKALLRPFVRSPHQGIGPGWTAPAAPAAFGVNSDGLQNDPTSG